MLLKKTNICLAWTDSKIEGNFFIFIVHQFLQKNEFLWFTSCYCLMISLIICYIGILKRRDQLAAKWTVSKAVCNFKQLSCCFKETIGFEVKALFASDPVLHLIRWCNKRILRKDYSAPTDFSQIEHNKLKGCMKKMHPPL